MLSGLWFRALGFYLSSLLVDNPVANAAKQLLGCLYGNEHEQPCHFARLHLRDEDPRNAFAEPAALSHARHVALNPQPQAAVNRLGKQHLCCLDEKRTPHAPPSHTTSPVP